MLPKIFGWCGILSDRIVGKQFIVKNLDQYMYWYTLEIFVLPFPNTLAPELLNNQFWKSMAVRHCLDET